MRSTIFSVLCAGLLFAGLAALAACSSRAEAEIQLPTVQCQACVQTISNALERTGGVTSFDVDLKKKAVRVEYLPTETDVTKIEQAIARAGYDANSTKADAGAFATLPDCCKIPHKQ